MPAVLLRAWDATNKKWIRLQADENGRLKVDMSNINIGDLADVDDTGPADDDLFFYDQASGLWKPGKLVDADIPASIARDAEVTAALAALTFPDLADTPANYTGEALKLLRVATGEDAVEFEDFPKTMAAAIKAWLHLHWFYGATGWTDSLTGTASISRGPYYQNLYTGATNGSRAASRITVSWTLNYGQPWVAIMPVGANVAYCDHSTDWIGYLTTYNNPTDIEAHMAFKIINGSIYASCANGSTQTITDTGIDLSSALNILMFRPLFTGATLTSIEYYVNGVLKATHSTNLPSAPLSLAFGETIINTAAEQQLLSLYPFDIFLYS